MMAVSLRLIFSLSLALCTAKLSYAAPIPIVSGLPSQTLSVCPPTEIGIARSPNLSTSVSAAQIVANDCGVISANPTGLCGSYGANSHVGCVNLDQPTTALTPDGTHWTCKPAIGSCTSLQNGVVEVIACCTRTTDPPAQPSVTDSDSGTGSLSPSNSTSDAVSESAPPNK
ncbi:hypothetical protein C8R42DRAFT_232461 [Lentinula raphanica]|nr:hypothetical protein C8R42DRAFT_232461 [Lentinula raphanica]